MQLTMKECGFLAFIFFTSPAVGTMVNGAPVPIDARNEINRLQNYNDQPNPVIQQRAPEQSSSGGGGLLGLVGKLAPFAEDILPMLALRDVEAPEPTKAAVKAPVVNKEAVAQKGAAPNAHEAAADKQAVIAHNAAEAHVKSVNELKSKILHDPSAREKLFSIITSAKAAHATPAPHAAAASHAPHAAREPEPATADASHQQAVEALHAKLASDPAALAKAEKLAHALALKSTAKAAPTVAHPSIAQRAPQASQSSSSGGGLLGLVGQLAPFAEDILPMLFRRDLDAREPEPATASKGALSHQQAVEALHAKLASDPAARAKAEKLAHALASKSAAHAAPTVAHATIAQRAPQASQSSSSGGGLLGLVGKLAPFAEDILPMLFRRDLDAREPEPATASKGALSHQQAVEALHAKLASDPAARAKAEKLAHALASKSAAHAAPTVAHPTIAQRAPQASQSSSSSGGGGLLGLVGKLAPFAEDILPMLF